MANEGFNIKLYKNTSPVNKIKKALVLVETYDGCIVKEATDIMNPIITISDSVPNILKGNYIYIENWHRYYFIQDVVTKAGKIVDVTLKCDVLYSFKDDILYSTCIALDSESSWNLYLDDGSLNAYQNPNRWTKKFSNTTNTRNFKLILTVAGG